MLILLFDLLRFVFFHRGYTHIIKNEQSFYLYVWLNLTFSIEQMKMTDEMRKWL